MCGLLKLLERQMILVCLSRLRPLQEVLLQKNGVQYHGLDFVQAHIEVLEERLE